jgi:diguanylate cyclase (GGDEF)-like protein
MPGLRANFLIKSLLGLTEPDNSLALNRRFLAQINELFRPSSAVLYDLFDEDGRWEFTTANLDHARARNATDAGRAIAFAIAEREDFIQCVTTGSRVVSSHRGRRTTTVYPIPGRTGVTALLATDHDNYPRHEREWIGYLLEGYANQRRLLYTLERDPLTQLLSRQTFDRQIWDIVRHVTAVARRGDDSTEPLCFCLLDIDHFKEVNDTFGHQYGDEVLLLFSQLIVLCFRHTDLTFRYGGEEFCIVLFDVDGSLAAQVLERFRATVEAFPFPQIGQRTVSIGFTQIREVDSPGELVGRADRALYLAKENGRNQVQSYDQLAAAGAVTENEKKMVGAIELF